MERACEIERESRMVDNAVELIKLSIDRGVEVKKKKKVLFYNSKFDWVLKSSGLNQERI